jgi:hypothetical protein
MAEKPPDAVPQTRVDSLDLQQAVGGTAAWRRLAVAFYSRVDRDLTCSVFLYQS